jgi:hypothetical protein
VTNGEHRAFRVLELLPDFYVLDAHGYAQMAESADVASRNAVLWNAKHPAEGPHRVVRLLAVAPADGMPEPSPYAVERAARVHFQLAGNRPENWDKLGDAWRDPHRDAARAMLSAALSPGDR